MDTTTPMTNGVLDENDDLDVALAKMTSLAKKLETLLYIQGEKFDKLAETIALLDNLTEAPEKESDVQVGRQIRHLLDRAAAIIKNDHTDNPQIHTTKNDLPNLVAAYNANVKSEHFSFKFENEQHPVVLIPGYARYMIEYLSERMGFEFKIDDDKKISIKAKR